MGLLDSFIENFDEVKESTGYGEAPEGVYDFVAGEPFVKEGSARDENWKGFMIPLILNDGGKDIEHTDVYTLPQSPNPRDWTEKESGAMSRLKSRLLAFGLSREEADRLDVEKIEGITGVLEIKHRTDGDRTFVNIRNFKANGRIDTGAAPAQTAVAVERPTRRRAAAQPDAAVEIPEEIQPKPVTRRTRKPKVVEPEPEREQGMSRRHTPEDLDELSGSDLKALGKSYGLDVARKRGDLIDDILDYESDNASDDGIDADPETGEVEDKPMALAEDEPEDTVAAIRARRAQRLAGGTRTNPFENA